MKIIKPEVHIENQDWYEILRRIEKKGRVCFKSEERITEESEGAFVLSLIQRGHLSVLEHASISVKFIVDRGISHEIVRHRIGAYSQESTRYCNYGRGEISFIQPFYFVGGYQKWRAWERACLESETMYKRLLDSGATPQEARSVLPTSLKTELWVTYNLRVWRHFFELRATKAAHPQMRQVTLPLLQKFRELMPVLFEGVPYDNQFSAKHYAEVRIV